ncbi:helix-turn-helix domain-containing protein [Sporolactobacillus sp. THM19-2]|uniref:helix-turn-helix domain-containing protein n=1 Tax=Sporolactobacillus sp. THM19-2 TaxID=2511171 RepID=UPI0034DD8F93
MKRHFEYGFTIIENRVFQSTAFDQLTDKFLYMTLIKFSFGKDSAFPSIATLAKHCLCAKNTIKNAAQTSGAERIHKEGKPSG